LDKNSRLTPLSSVRFPKRWHAGGAMEILKFTGDVDAVHLDVLLQNEEDETESDTDASWDADMGSEASRMRSEELGADTEWEDVTDMDT
jgi:hypothetical protein